MTTFAERFREAAVPRLMDEFAERDADGNFGGVKYWPAAAPDGSQGVLWSTIVSGIELQDSQDDGSSSHQDKELREVVTLHGANPTTPFDKNGAFEIARYGDVRFEIETVNRGELMTTVRAYRYAMQSKQRRGVERGR